MRVLYVGNFDPFETGGTRRAFEVVRRVHRYGVEPYILHVKSVPNDFFTRIGALRSLKEYIVVGRGLSYLKSLDVDLVVATSESPSTVLTAYHIAKKLQKPWTTIMQLPIKLRYTPASTEPIVLDPLWLPQQLAVLNVLRKTIVLTVSLSCIVESTVKPPKYLVIKPGVGIDVEKYLETKVYEKIFDAIFMARLTPEKGVYDVVKIWREVVKVHPKATLAVAGKFKDGKTMSKFFKLVEKYDLKKNITYLGYISENVKAHMLKSARIFVYPSILDAFPIVVLEALACGLPVIAYDIPAIRYNYPHNIVIRVSKKDVSEFTRQVLLLINDDNKLKKIGEKAKRFASLFTWDNVVKAETSLYENVIRHNKNSPN